MPRWNASKDPWDSIKNPEDKFSLKHMQYLCELCEKQAGIVGARNQEFMVEVLRQLAELILWGDQHDPQFFDIFLEKTTLTFLMQVLHTDAILVKIQLLQTLSILIQNLKSEMALFYLLSNNYINDLITYEWSFQNEDVMANYVSFLKTISLKLNSRTIQFFFNGMRNTFPLYTEAIKFYDSKESMVRVAVKTLTLNVYRVKDAPMLKFVMDKTAAPYFSNIVLFIVKQLQRVDANLSKSKIHEGELQEIMDELLDLFYYIQDIFALNLDQMNRILTFHLIEYLVAPILVGSLKMPSDASTTVEEPTSSPSESTAESIRIHPGLALYVIAQFFQIFNHGPFLNAAGAFVIHPSPKQYTFHYKLPANLQKFNEPPDFASGKSKVVEEGLPKKVADTKAVSTRRPRTSSGASIESLYSVMVKPSTPLRADRSPASDAPIASIDHRETGRESLLEYLKGDDDHLILGSLCVLYSIVRNHNFERKMLAESGLFPHRLVKVQSLLDSLISGETTSPSHSTDLFGDSGSDLFADSPDQNENVDHEMVLIEALLSILLRLQKYRIVTLDLAIMVLMELIGGAEQGSKMSPKQMKHLQLACEMAVANLRERLMNSEVGEVFLELFENENKSMQPLNVEDLVVDYNLLLPIPHGPTRGYDFTMRLPEGDLEETRKAIQAFLRTRKLRLSIENKKDDILPLKNCASSQSEGPSLQPGQTIEVDANKPHYHCEVISSEGVGGRTLLVQDPFFLVVSQTATDDSSNTAVIQNSLELQNIEAVVSQTDKKVLLTKAGSMEFATEAKCLEAKKWVDKAKQQVRHRKLEQLYLLLGISQQDAKSISRRRSKPIVFNSLAKPSPHVSIAAMDSNTDSVEEIQLDGSSADQTEPTTEPEETNTDEGTELAEVETPPENSSEGNSPISEETQ